MGTRAFIHFCSLGANVILWPLSSQMLLVLMPTSLLPPRGSRLGLSLEQRAFLQKGVYSFWPGLRVTVVESQHCIESMIKKYWAFNNPSQVYTFRLFSLSISRINCSHSGDTAVALHFLNELYLNHLITHFLPPVLSTVSSAKWLVRSSQLKSLVILSNNHSGDKLPSLRMNLIPWTYLNIFHYSKWSGFYSEIRSHQTTVLVRGRFSCGHCTLRLKVKGEYSACSEQSATLGWVPKRMT